MQPSFGPYRAMPPEKARSLVHPRRSIADAIVTGALCSGVGWVGWRFIVQSASVPLALGTSVLAVVLAALTLARGRSTKLTIDPGTRRLIVVHGGSLRPRTTVAAELDSLESLKPQVVSTGEFRLVLTSESKPDLPLSERFEFTEEQARREYFRVHAFVFPEREAPPLPAGPLRQAFEPVWNPGRVARRSRLSPTLIALAVLGGLFASCAGLAIYGVKRKLTHSKTAEPPRSLATIERAAKQHFETGTLGPNGATIHTFCPSAPRTPAVAPSALGVTVPSDGWRTDGWLCLGFSIDGPQYYSYVFTSNYPATGSGASFTAEANGDLDGNGVVSTFRLVGRGTEAGAYERVSYKVTNEDE